MVPDSPEFSVPASETPRDVDGEVRFPLPGDSRVPPERSRLERIRGIARPDLLRLALEQLLRGWQPSELSREDLTAFDRMYGVDAEQARELRARVFEDVLEAFLAAGTLSSAERGYLRDLQRTLDLDQADVQDARERLGAPHFRAALAAAIADGAVTAEERAALAELASGLHIPRDLAAQAVECTARRLLDQVWQAATASGRLPENLAPRMREAADALGIVLAPEQERLVSAVEAHVAQRRAREEHTRMQRDAERAERALANQEQHRRAAAERERADQEQHRLATTDCARTDAMLRELQKSLDRSELPIIEVRVPLRRDERCHCAQPAEWHERQSDPADRFAEPRLACLDRGVVYVTDRRLVFEGGRMMSSIQHGDITSIVHQPDGLEIGRRVDPAVYLVMRPAERVAAVGGVLAHFLDASSNV